MRSLRLNTTTNFANLLSVVLLLTLVLGNGAFAQHLAIDRMPADSHQGPVIKVFSNQRPIDNGATDVTEANNTDFGSHKLFGDLAYRTFVIRNEGDDILQMQRTGRAVKLNNTDSLTFKVTEEVGSNRLGVGDSTSFTIRFDPDTAGQQSATVAIRSNDSSRSPYTFRIVGNGSRETGRASPQNARDPFEVYHSQGQLRVTFEQNAGLARTLTLYNLTGQAVRQRAVEGGKQSLSLSSNGLPAGLYILHTQTDQSQASRKVLIR